MPPMLALTLIELAVLIVLLGIIAAALTSIALTLSKHYGGSSPPPAPGSQALTDLQTAIRQIIDSGQSPTAEQCQRMRDLLLQARSQGVSDVVIDALRAQIDKLCGS